LIQDGFIEPTDVGLVFELSMNTRVLEKYLASQPVIGQSRNVFY